MIVHIRTAADSRRPAPPKPRPTFRRNAMCQFIAMALFGGGVAHAATTPPAFSPAWFATKQPGATPPSAPSAAANNGNNVSFSPGSAFLQQRVQQSIQNLNNAAAAVAAQMQAQKDAQSAAQQLVSNVPDGLGKGGLTPSAGIGSDPSLWQNANAPTDTVAGGKHTVEIKQTDKKAILTWDTFNVGRNTTLYFNQSAGSQSDGKNDWIALNRINDPSATPSQILGQIKSDGSVYLINRNGFLFGAGSQVNTHSLIASSLSLFSDDVKASNQKFLSGGIGSDAGAPILQVNFTDGSKHDVVIEKGASITAGSEGFVLIAAPNVSNAGSIVADDGQAVLAASTSLSNANLSGELEAFNSDTSIDPWRGLVSNTGIVQARRGSISLLGYDVTQAGVVVASTSISHPGSVNIDASAGRANLENDALIFGKLLFAAGSVTTVLPEKDGSTTSSSAAADKAFVNGSMSLSAGDVEFAGNSLLEAPGADINVVARTKDATGNTSTGRIYVDREAVIDVSGLANVALPMSALLVTIPRVGQNELADSPLLRNSFLYTQKDVVIDSSQSGTRADGVDWVGSPILNAAGYVENVPRDISQMLTRGGNLSLTGDQVLVREGSQLKLDGGYVAYQAGWINTPNLLGADGRIYNIASADPNVDYVGFAGQYTSNHARWGVSETYGSPIMGGTRRWDDGFITGSDAGTFTVNAATAASLDGDISAEAFAGDRQVVNGSQPDGGSFVFTGSLPNRSATYQTGVRLQENSLVLDDLVPGFSVDTPWETVLAAQDGKDNATNLRDWMIISTDMIGKAGFANVDISSPGTIIEAAGTTLAVQAGGNVSLNGGRIDIDGSIVAPAGNIALTTGAPVVGQDQTTFIPADITIADGALLSTRGLWVNDTGQTIGNIVGDRYINGGTVSLTTDQAYVDQAKGSDGTGSIDLQTGSLIDVSGGGYVDTDGRVRMQNGVPVGSGGDVSIRTYAEAQDKSNNYGINFPPPSALRGGRVTLDGAVRGYGFSGGGNFTLKAQEIRIGGSRNDLASSDGLWLDPSFFMGQGFDNYQLTAVTDATIAANTHVRVQRSNLLPNLDSLRLLASGSDIYDPAVSTVGTLDAYTRWATRDTRDGHGPGFSLGSGEYLSWQLVPLNRNGGAPSYKGVNGTVLLDHGASVDVDASGSVSLRGTQATLVHGSIRAPGGSIDVGTRDLNAGTPTPNGVTRAWLGNDAVLDASGVSLVNPFASPVSGGMGGIADQRVPRTGVVLSGGSITLESNSGYVVAEKGVVLDVSGAADTYELPVAATRLNGLNTDYLTSSVWSDAGSINIVAAAGLLNDATLRALGGSASAEGGILSIGGTSVPNFPAPTSILVRQSGGFVAAGSDERGEIEAGAPSGVLNFAADSLNGSGITTLNLGSVKGATIDNLSVGFAGNVDLSLGRAVTITASDVVALPDGARNLTSSGGYTSGNAQVHIAAPYVSLVGVKAGVKPVLLAGDGTLDIDADSIDIGGKLNLQRWADANFIATGDIRVTAPELLAYDQGAPITGVLFSTGNLTFQAAQLYPATDYRFVIDANAAGIPDGMGKSRETTVTVLPNGPSYAPLSAGGSLLIDADHVEQSGTVRVPSGSLVLGVGDAMSQAADFGIDPSMYPLVATSSVHLAAGSLTSVSLDGLTVPYGTTVDGTEWRYNESSGVQSADKTAPPAKQVLIHGEALSLDEGATIDLSGGGSLQAAEWVPGTGGTRDVLAQHAAVVDGASTSGQSQYPDGRAIYAVVPGHQSPVAAYDAAFATQGGDSPDIGKQVYLSGVPGLPAGWYTLMPARYASLPGAYRIVQDTSAVDSVMGRSARQADGGYAVTGYFGDALTGAHDARNTTFLVQSRDVWQQYSQYTITDADTFFGGQAKNAGQVAPRLTADAGQLMLDAGSRLDLGAQLSAEPGKGGRSSQVDIAGQAIQIVGADETARDGYLSLSADGLTRLGAGSLLIGGTRTSTGEGDLVDSVADNVVLSNDAAHPLAGQEIMLVARGGDKPDVRGVVLDSGSVIQASGIANPVGSQPIVFGADPGKDVDGSTTPAVSGDGVMLRVSQNGAATVVRHQVTGFDGPSGTPGGQLTVGAGASVQGGSALTLDATGPMHVDENAILNATAIDANANRIVFVGEGQDGGTDGLVLGPRTLDLFRGATDITLRSRGEMDFLGNLDISLDHALTLNAGALVGDGGDVVIRAAQLGFGNSLGGAAPATPAAGGGHLDVQGGEIDFGAGNQTVQGFSAFSATATQGMLGQGMGGMDFGTASVDLSAPVFIADGGSLTSLKTTGAMRLTSNDGKALSSDALGGSLSLVGSSVDVGMDLLAAAGALSIDATQGNLHVSGSTFLNVGGVNRTFFDTKAYAPGGSLRLIADHGDVAVDSGSSLAFGGGSEGGDAGSLTVGAGNAVQLDGSLNGHAQDGWRGAYFTYSAGTAVDLDGVVGMANAAGATGLVDISSGVGDLHLSTDNSLRSGKVYLYANGGTARIDGTIDASGPVAGRIELYGRNGVDVEGSLLATSSIAEQRGGDVVIGTSGHGDGTLNPIYGYEQVQHADAGFIHIGAGARIDVSGGSTAAIAGGRVSFRAPLLVDGDVPIQIDNARSLTGARDVTIEPYAVWSTADTKDASHPERHFDGLVDPAGWYTRDADGKPVLVAGTWTDASGRVLDPPADDELQTYLSKNFFTPDSANADHTGFYGYMGGDATNGPGTLMGFIEQPGFGFGPRYSAITNIHVRPGVELDNPADGSGTDNGAIRVLTNWNLGAGTTDAGGRISLLYRFGKEAPVLTLRAGGDLDLSASISDGFYQQNTGAVLSDPAAPPPAEDDHGYANALLGYQQSEQYLDDNNIWNNGTINLSAGRAEDAQTPGGGTADITKDPFWAPLQAPLTNQTANYYANYESYIDEVGDGMNQKWAATFLAMDKGTGFLAYHPSPTDPMFIAPSPTAFSTYDQYLNAYTDWLSFNFFDFEGFRETTPTPVLQPLDIDYVSYSKNYTKYIAEHNFYYNQVSQAIGNPTTGTQVFYAPSVPRGDNGVPDPAYNSALASYQTSLKYLDDNGAWNNGTIKLADGRTEDGATPGGGTVDLTKDPFWAPLQAPLQGQSANYYTNYSGYINEVGDGTNQQWAAAFVSIDKGLGFLAYHPADLPAPVLSDSPTYDAYLAAYSDYLNFNFFDFDGYRQTPAPVLLPVDTNYTSYTNNYAKYITSHNQYFNYVSTAIGNSGTGFQLSYAPFAPKSDVAKSLGPYDTALAAYQTSLKFLDDTGIWNNGTIKLKDGSLANGATPGGGTADISKDPYWAPLQAPLQDQSPNYYTNYSGYIGEVGDGSDGKWAQFFESRNRDGFLGYRPTTLVAPQPDAFSTYDAYAAAYQTWLSTNFRNETGLRDFTPSPILAPIDADYVAYTADYSKYILGHSQYDTYVQNNVGNGINGSQMFYAPFAPRENSADEAGVFLPIPPASANNSPSNMPSLGNPVPFASATLLGGPSSSFRFVAGADFTSADPLTVGAPGTGNVTLDGHFAVKDTLTDKAVVDPGSPFAGKTLLFPTTIRTGTGSIDVASAGDIRWQDAVSPAAVYTAGEPAEGTSAGTGVSVLRPAVTAPEVASQLPDMLVSGLVNPENAGDIRLSAGGNVDAIQNPVDIDGSVTKGNPGASIAQYWWQWMQIGNASDGSRSSIDFANFAQGIMSAGGNVSVDAGGDISQLSVSLPTTWYLNPARDAYTTVGGGNLDVHAGGSILSGAYFVARGMGNIGAQGAIAASTTLADVSTGTGLAATSFPVSTIFGLQDADVAVNAGRGADIGGVYDPSYYSGGTIFQALLPVGHADQQGYSTDSSFSASTTGGDLTFGSLKSPGAVFGAGEIAGPILPAAVSMTAFDGSIDVLTDGQLYPSASGNLSMLAAGDIAFSRQTVGDSTGTVFGLIDQSGVMPSPLAPVSQLSIGYIDFQTSTANTTHDALPLHGSDDEPVRIYALGGDIIDGIDAPNGFNYLSLVIAPAKQAMIYAGRDIVNLTLIGQHTHDADITRVAAGRDIYDTAFSSAPGFANYVLGGYTLAPKLLLGGPGSFLVEAGRNIGPLTTQSEVSTTNAPNAPTGIQSIGNLYNPFLPHEGADVNVAFGVGPGVDTAGFLAHYLDHPDSTDGLGSLDADLVAFMNRRVAGQVVDTGYAKDKPEVALTVEQARTLFEQEPEYVQRLFAERALFKILGEVGNDYNDASSPFHGQYVRGYTAIDALFPSSYGYTANGSGQGGLNGAETPVSTGSLDIRSTSIQTQQGGDVTIVGPGGQALIGSTSAPGQITDATGKVVAGPNTMGILTLERGDINMFTDRSVLLAQSRIFTEQGGDMVIWSSNGDINAGLGAKTTAEIPPPVYVCNVDAWCRIDARGQVSGAGIATLQTVEGAEAGNVYLIAPRGTVDAGDAGIRVAGDLFIAAARVANADNIQVQGESAGVPVVAAVNIGALNAASAAASAATKAAEDVARKQQSDARDRLPSVISVSVLRDGNNGASVVSPELTSPVQVLGGGRLDSARADLLTPEEKKHLRN